MDFLILIVDDEHEMCLSFSEIFQKEGYQTIISTNPLNVDKILTDNSVDLILMDIKMPELSGIDLLKKIKKADRNIPIFMITGFPSIENAVKAMKYGASDYLVKPLDVKSLLEKIKLVQESFMYRNRITEDLSIIGVNPVVREMINEIEKVAPTKAPVLIFGENGTGKELVANELHLKSNRKRNVLIKVNCASIPDTLIESELFGYEKGAFTDAKSRQRGFFEQANGGSIFLDEIGDMSIKTQSKILRILQDGKIQRLGSGKSISTDTRIISATNQNLEKLIAGQKFRQDLFYRLSVVTFTLPPLRDRKDDIPYLCDHFISRFNREYGKKIKNLSLEVKNIFEQHSWPGNVRELKNCLERAVIFSDGNKIELTHLPCQYREMTSTFKDAGYKAALEMISREMIKDALIKSNGVKQKAAKILKIHRKTLYNRMKKLGFE